MADRHKQNWAACFGRLIAVVFLGLLLTADGATPPATAGSTWEEHNIEKHAVKRVLPVYPPMAQRYRIEGVVVVEVSVGKDGKVTKAEFVRGQNIFRSVSLDAAKRWEFKTTPDNLEGTINFTFKLGG